MTAPFAQQHYDLGAWSAGLSLRTLPVGLAEDLARIDDLGRAFAAMDPWLTYTYDPTQLARYFATVEPDAPRLAVRLGDDLAGVVVIRANWLRGPYLQFLGVLPAFQGRGIGSAVVAWLVAEAGATGASNVFVCVSDFNAGARRLYGAHGFAEAGQLADFIAPGHTELLLRRPLGTRKTS